VSNRKPIAPRRCRRRCPCLSPTPRGFGLATRCPSRRHRRYGDRHRAGGHVLDQRPCGAVSASSADFTYRGVLARSQALGRRSRRVVGRIVGGGASDVLLALPATSRPWGIGMRTPSLDHRALMEAWAHGLDVLPLSALRTRRHRRFGQIGVARDPVAPTRTPCPTRMPGGSDPVELGASVGARGHLPGWRVRSQFG